MPQNNIIEIETKIQKLYLDVEDLKKKIKKKTISAEEKKAIVLPLHNTAKQLNKQVHENLCREKYTKAFNSAYNTLINLYNEVLDVDTIRRDI